MSKSSTRRLITALLVLLAALLAFTEAACGAPGYWTFDHVQVKPTQESLDAIKAGPGRILEQHVTGAFQPKFAGKGTISMSVKVDDPDHKVYLTTYLFNFGTDTDMRVLAPGQILKFKGDVGIAANAGAAWGNGKMAIDLGDYFLAIDAGVNRNGNGAGEVRIPGGSPNAVMDIYASAYMANLGALGSTVDIFYRWVEGAPPVLH